MLTRYRPLSFRSMGYERTRSRPRHHGMFITVLTRSHDLTFSILLILLPFQSFPLQTGYVWFGSIVAVLAAFAVVAGYGTYKLMVSR